VDCKMKLKKFFTAAMATAATVAVMATSAFALTNTGINWNKNVITVTGSGYPPSGSYVPSQARKLAERAAIADAYRQLAEVVEGVNVTGETTVQGLMLLSDKTNVKVQAVIKGAQQVGSTDTGDGGVEVTMQLPLFGSGKSLAGAVFEKPAAKVPFPTPKPNVVPSKPAYTSSTPVNQRIDIVIKNSSPNTKVTINKNPLASAVPGLNTQEHIYTNYGLILTPMSKINISALPKTNSTEQVAPASEAEKNLSSDAEIIGGYTGVIVDCSGLELQPVMSPTIKNEDGETIYGDKNLDYDKVIELGMASYSDGSYGLERAGDNPIVVKAVELSNFHSNPVLSVEDSNRVLLENQSTKFLDKLNVVFLDSATDN